MVDGNNFKYMRQNGPDMVVQGARCNGCSDWKEFEIDMPVFRVNGRYDCVIGPECNCFHNDERLWVLFYMEWYDVDKILI
jgi:hypothetical protein